MGGAAARGDRDNHPEARVDQGCNGRDGQARLVPKGVHSLLRVQRMSGTFFRCIFLVSHHKSFIVSLMRLALRDHTFQDGTTIPAGSLVAVPSTPIHGDTEYYERADEFMPFRFTEGYDDVNSKRQFTATSLEYRAFLLVFSISPVLTATPHSCVWPR